MRKAIFKTKGFYVGLVLFSVLTLIAVLKPDLNMCLRSIIIFVCLILYVFQEMYQASELLNKVNPIIINGILASIDKFLQFDSTQRLRSNIFFCNEKTKKYFIKYKYNMDLDNDKNIQIAVNRGCTGDAWSQKKQVWGTKDLIFSKGDYRLTSDELEKVPSDLEWICSTPILKDDEVIAVLNFDGNKPMDSAQQKEIMDHCNKICEKIKEIL